MTILIGSYSTFEDQFLAAIYFTSNALDGVGASFSDVSARFQIEHLDPAGRWLGRALEHFVQAGWAEGPLAVGDLKSEQIELTAAGLRQAERLIQDNNFFLEPIKSPSSVELVPASDRIVRLDDNRAGLHQAASHARKLATDIVEANDVGFMTDDARLVAAAEVSQIAEALMSPALRIEAFIERTESTLRWVASEAAGALVGTAALALLALIANLLGFSI